MNGLDTAIEHLGEAFGPEGDTFWSLRRLEQTIPGYQHHEIDIRDREGILRLVQSERPAIIVHTAAQPSQRRTSSGPAISASTNGQSSMIELAEKL